ncbi:MAG: ferritin-like domain-containing protein [Solirubrobacterales bacterium]
MSDNDHPELAPAGAAAHWQDGLSRSDLLLKGALAVGVLYGLSAVAPYVSRALAAEDADDVEVLNFLLSFEYLQVSLYNRASTETNDKGEALPLKGKERELVTLLLAQEAQHVKALQEVIEDMGGKPAKKGNYAFAFRIFEQFLTIANTIESVSVGAYNGAITRIESDKARNLTYSIVQVDARHAATVSIGVRENPAPEPFDLGLLEETAINHVVQFTGVYPELPETGEAGDEGE